MPRYYDDDDFDDLDIGRYRRSRQRDDDGPRPQSGLGIGSLILSLLCGVSLFGLILMAAIASANQNGPANDKDPAMVALGLGIIASCGFSLIGLVLGLVGCFQPDRSPLCAILGSIFNALILLGVGGLLCLGLAIGG